ncbi:hypothetical protein PAXRUDRAFT_156001 [Paxillus rubicundulus Ve08.2h10]|uniref:Uncharacterized protein n=1 Tax=Paxillus rubicundulus Ve08.2h10 TaxID=930991 RepID=A0A0D0DQB6_9AGAM|nr:hypothetical protein PAXRUDRAFT_156001 [Paxillus rubicundulus Ve08.2h10]
MSSNTASADTPTCLTLIGSSKFQIWKLQIMAKLQREKVLGVALGTDVFSPTLSRTWRISGTAMSEEAWKWMEWNKRTHRIIQDNISNALLLKMEIHTTARDTFDALLCYTYMLHIPCSLCHCLVHMSSIER